MKHVLYRSLLCFCNSLHLHFLQVIEEFGGDDGEGAQNSLPQSRECKVEQKKFYFDVGRNDRGVFLRLTEVTYCRESSKLFSFGSIRT